MTFKTAAGVQIYAPAVCRRLQHLETSSPLWLAYLGKFWGSQTLLLLKLIGLTGPLDHPENPRDINCKLHKYTLKDRIMQKMRNKPYFDFDGAKLFFYEDLSRCSLMQCRALHPLLTAIQEAGLTYRWGFPFSLQVTKEGRQVTLRNKDDLPHFLSALELRDVDFLYWRGTMDLPALSLPQLWLPARGKGHSRRHKRPTSGTSPGSSTPRD